MLLKIQITYFKNIIYRYIKIYMDTKVVKYVQSSQIYILEVKT